MEGYELGVGGMANALNLQPSMVVNFIRDMQELDTMENIGRSDNTKTLFFQREKNTVSNITSDMLKSLEAK